MEYLKSSIIITALIFAACSEFPDVEPTVLDTQLDEGRVYKVIDKKNFIIQFDRTIPVKEMNGYFCLSQKDFAEVKEYVINNQNKCN
jgi:hypothetical protein